MSINRSGEFGPLRSRQISPLDQNHNDDREEGGRRKVSYRGRSWQEEDEDLPVQPTAVATAPEDKKKTRGVYADGILLEKAEKALLQFVTIEEKVAQLCFCMAEAYYDSQAQIALEIMIQKCQIGGFLFTKGEFRRQAYLIERFQEVSKTPLLIGNEFFHGLSFYFQEEVTLEKLEKMDERKSSDLGKAVVFQNKKLGVHFQFDGGALSHLRDSLVRSFRNGVKEAQGLVARERKCRKKHHPVFEPTQSSFFSLISKSDNIQEAFGLRTLYFIDFTVAEQESDFALKILEAFSENGDAFLLRNRVEEAIEVISDAIKRGKLSERELDRKLIKILLLKKI